MFIYEECLSASSFALAKVHDLTHLAFSRPSVVWILQSQQKAPFVHPLHTKLTKVKDIPYFVTDQFMRSYYRDRYQLAQVERMVERSYQQYLVQECRNQRAYKRQLEHEASKSPADERESNMKRAQEYELGRCIELQDLFPQKNPPDYKKRSF